jgi:putative hemolysin
MFEIIVIVLCLFFNAVLSCIEMAFVTVSRAHLKQLAAKGNSAASRTLKLKENPERTLSVLQIGITLVGAVSAAVGGAGAEENLSPIIEAVTGWSEETSEAISIFLIVIPLTYLSVVIGELVPKSLALKYPMRLALSGGYILILLDKIFAPFVFILDQSTRFILSFISKKLPAETFTEINTSVDLDPLSDVNKQYVLNLVSVDKRTVKDIFVKWEEVTKIDISLHYLKVLQVIKDSRHTRLPVIENEKVVGILHSKEFVSEGEVSKLDWTELIRPVIRLNPSEPIFAALKKLQAQRSHLAVVEADDVAIGIVTIEDIFEEVVGDIFDEDDSPNTLLSTNSKIRTLRIGENKKK